VYLIALACNVSDSRFDVPTFCAAPLMQTVISLLRYSVAFPRMSRPIFSLANSARKRLISICSAGVLDCPTPCWTG